MKMMVHMFLGIEYHKSYVLHDLNNAPWYICQLRSYTSIQTEVITNLYLPTPTNIFGYYWCENHHAIERAIIVVVCGYDISLKYLFHTKEYVTNPKTRNEYRVWNMDCRRWLNLKIIIRIIKIFFSAIFLYDRVYSNHVLNL